MRFHGLRSDAMNFDQLAVVPIDKSAVFIQHKGEAAGHTSAKVDPRGTQYGNEATGHVFTTVITCPFDHSMGTRIAHRKSLTGNACREKPAPGGTIEAGITDNAGDAAFKPAALWW